MTWQPTSDYLDGSRVAAFMRRHGSTSLNDLRHRSIKDPDWYWDAVVEDLGIPFASPYRVVRDASAGATDTRWFVDGRINVADACVQRWADDPERRDTPAVIAESETGAVTALSFGQLDARVNELAAALRGAGIGKGDAVGIFMPMVAEAAIAMYAVAKIGALCVPIFSGFAAPAVAARLADSGAKLLLTASDTVRRGRRVLMEAVAAEAIRDAPQVRTVVVLEGAEAAPALIPPERHIPWQEFVAAHHGARIPSEDTAAEDPFMIAYTSGTTGQPKGAVHVHGGFLVKVASEAAYQTDIGAADVLFWLSDMGWIMGAWSVLGANANGAAVVLYEGAPDQPDSGRLWSLVRRHRITVFGVSPTLVRALRAAGPDLPAHYDLSSLRILASAGEPWDEAPYHWYLGVTGGRCPIINFSGGTEVGACFLSNYPVEAVSARSLGGPSLGMAVDVFDPDGTPLRGAVGELVCTQPWPGMTRGLWGDRKRYVETYWTTYPGVWRHGDWALVDTDGQWYLLGRSDDAINVAGKRVSPAEIESLMSEHPGVRDVAVVGIPHASKGEAIWAFVVADSAANGYASALSEVVVAGMGRPFRPEQVVFVGALPKTASGKTVRRVLRAAVTGSALGDASTLQNPESLPALVEAIAGAR